MTISFRKCCLCACLALVPLAYAYAAPSTEPGNNTAGAWEHLALTHTGTDLDAGLGKQINKLGDEGWELVSVVSTVRDSATDSIIFCFKRPK